MATGGYQLNSPAAVDSSLVTSASATTNGSSFDLGVNTSPQAVRNVAQFTFTGGATNGYDMEVRVQWSDDNTTWPSSGEGDIVLVRTDSTASASLTSQWVELPAPKARYARFQYKNNNATDAVTVSSEVAQHKLQSA